MKGFKIVDDDVSWDTFTPKPDEFDEVNDKLLVSVVQCNKIVVINFKFLELALATNYCNNYFQFNS